MSHFYKTATQSIAFLLVVISSLIQYVDPLEYRGMIFQTIPLIYWDRFRIHRCVL